MSHSFLHHLARTATLALIRSAAVATGAAPAELAIWWITHR